MTFKRLAFFLIVLGITMNCTAQIDSLQDLKDLSDFNLKKSKVKILSSFLSNSIYQGRQTSYLESLITTGLIYYHKSGAFIGSSFTYIPNAGFHIIDRKDLTAGYEFLTDKIIIATYFTKYFYSDSSSEIQAAVSSSAGISGSYDFNYLTVGAAADFNFVTKTDIVLNANLGHSFWLANNNLWISPIININAGTENFYQSYFSPNKNGGSSASTRAASRSSNRAARRRRTANSNIPVNSNNTGSSYEKVTILNANAFKIMDYEIGVPVEYKFKKFMVSVTPTYIIPVHPATLLSNNITSTEILKKAFVVEAGISYTF